MLFTQFVVKLGDKDAINPSINPVLVNSVEFILKSELLYPPVIIMFCAESSITE